MQTIPAKQLVYSMKKGSEWFGADYNMNIYRGCSHGCIYCDSRSACYKNPDFDTIKVKENALELIRDDLRRKVKKGVVATGAMSDPYNPLERELFLTRNALELINAFRFGVAIDTKSALVERDIDILQDIKRHSPVIVKMTITTGDDVLCKKLEPNVYVSSERFIALNELSGGDIFCGVLMMPLLPFINDTEENVLGIVEKAKAAGARFVYPAFGMTLRQGNREYYYEKLDALFPGMNHKYAKAYGERYMCTSRKAKKLWGIFVERCQELELLYDMKAITRAYKSGYEQQQLSFI